MARIKEREIKDNPKVMGLTTEIMDFHFFWGDGLGEGTDIEGKVNFFWGENVKFEMLI